MSKLDIWANGLNMPTYTNTGNLLTDARQIIDESRKAAYRAINVVMLQRNWLLGKRIQEEILLGKDRADYGVEVIKNLSKTLTEIYGKGFNKNNLYGFVSFYKIFPTVSGKSEILSWSHYLLLINVQDGEARRWYAHEAYAETWSVRTLRRNIASQYYYRLLQSQDKKAVADEMHSLTTSMQGDKLEVSVSAFIPCIIKSSNSQFRTMALLLFPFIRKQVPVFIQWSVWLPFCCFF